MPRPRTARPMAEQLRNDIADVVRVRAARATFVSAIAADMLAHVAAGMAPRWSPDAAHATAERVARWSAFDYLDGLLSQANVDVPLGMPPGSRVRELREMIANAAPHLRAEVIRTGYTLADTIEAVERQ